MHLQKRFITWATMLIKNDGPKIIGTDYWSTDYARRGFAYISMNAGRYRLLLPDPLVGEIGEMSTGRRAILCRGAWPDGGKSDALDLIFDDGSDSPYSLQLSIEQCDRLPSDSDTGERQLDIYGPSEPPEILLSMPIAYRRVSTIPAQLK